MAAAMEASRKAADPDDKINVYQNQLKQLAQVRESYNNAAMASDNWHVQTVKNISASERFTDQVRKQKLGIGELSRAYKEYRRTGGGALGESIKEQTALRNATASQMTSSLFGKNVTDLHVPKTLGPELDNARIKLGMISQAIQSASTQMVNWGKNTQWAGRQITVGLTVPLGMAAVGAASLALKVDTELTRIAKVYDTVNTTAAGKEAELAQVRESGLAQATTLAQEYGAAMEDTLNIQAQLAATGKSGAELFRSTAEVTRIATLGEMDHQDAIDMTISLQTAFKLSTQELTEAFNFMNQVENSTSLSIQDIAEAVPRAASAFAALGGTVQEMTVLMAALKESGIDPTVGANALKSASSTLLKPTEDAIAYWKNNFTIDLPKIVDEADGNLYKILTRIGELTHALDPQKVQAGINVLFGKYQFDRSSALITNLGDAMTGVTNQTAEAMKAAQMTPGDLASKADQEIKRLQDSVSFRFKAAIESIKASLVPLGMTVLQIVTPIAEGIGWIIDQFNGLSGVTKGIILSLLGIGAVVGPLLMLVGIFANLIGNVVKFGASMAAMRMKFRAVSADEAAAEIMAKRAASAFDTEGSSAARLTLQIQALTEAMEQNAVAQGLMMDKTGKILSPASGDAAAQARRVQQVGNNLAYAPGSRDASGKDISGGKVTQEDAAMFAKMGGTAKDIETSAVKTRMSYDKIGKIIGGVAASALIFGTIADSMGDTASSMVNIGMTVASIAFMFPGAVGKAGTLLAKATTMLKSWPSLISKATSGGAISKITGAISGGFSAGGIKGVGSSLAALAPRLTTIAGAALRIFGPVGILAGGALLLKGMVEDSMELENAQRALASSGQAWADALGFTYAPGKLPGMSEEDVNNQGQIVELQNKMMDSSEGLADALQLAAESGDEYSASMSQALRVIMAGGDAAQARQAFEASLEMAGIGRPRIDQLLIQFDKVDLADPEEVRAAINAQLAGAFNDVASDSLLVQNGTDSVADTFTGWIRNALGGDLSDVARESGSKLGVALGDGLLATTDPAQQGALFTQVKDQMNTTFGSMFGEMYADPELGAILRDNEVGTADELATMMKNITTKLENDEALTGPEQAIKDAWDNSKFTPEMNKFNDAYSEMLDTLIQGMVDAGQMSQEQADKIREAIGSVGDLRTQTIGDVADPKPLMDTAKAAENYAREVQVATAQGAEMSEAQKLAALNFWRAKAGMDAAANSAQGFGDATHDAAGNVDELAAATAGITATAEQQTGMLQSAMSGTMNDIYQEADRRMQLLQQNEIDNINTASNRRKAALDRRGKNEDKYYDARQKALNKAQKAEDKAFNKNWDNIEKGAEDYYDNMIDNIEKSIDATKDQAEQRIDAIQAQIDAESDADDERQKIFDRERTRIERMAELFSNNIDFNAALNSGNMDEAANIYSNTQATTQQWGLDDQQAAGEEASAARQATLENTIKEIETERDARVNALDAQKDAVNREKDARLESLRAQREAENEAMQERQEQEAELLATRRAAAADALAAARASEEARTQATISSTQRQQEAERRGLAARLRELQAFTPRNETELKEHTARVEGVYREYGLDLQTQGNGWGKFVGNALSTNVRTAATDLQNQINWQAMGQVMANRISQGAGVTANDLQYLIRNGKFPSQGGSGGIFDSLLGFARNLIGRHSGGDIGGPGFSQKDRTGVPRSASLFPSETMAVLKKGEFVVNERATRANRGLLENLNARHEGGAAETGPLMAGGSAVGIFSALESAIGGMAMEQMVASGMASRNTEAIQGGGYGGKAQGTSQIDRMFNTIKAAFPKARLNDGYRPGANDYHGKGKAIDLGLQGVAGGAGNSYMAGMNQWIHDNIPNVFELIYDGLGDNRPDLKRGKPLNYGAATANQHKNHVHWAMESFHRGGFADLVPQLQAGGFTMSEGLANLHPDEAVLTKPLTDQFKQNVANSTENGYNVNIEFSGPVNSEVDIERGVYAALEKIESKKGRKRVVK